MKTCIKSRVCDLGVVTWRSGDVYEIEILLFRSKERFVVGVDPRVRKRLLSEVTPGFADIGHRYNLNVVRGLRPLEISRDVTFSGDKAITDQSASKLFHSL
jgi:uncharacterized protein (DUF2461 family)